MIKIITGSLNSGKTTRLIKHYLENEKGDGFASIKIMNGDDVVGFDAMHLGSKQRKRLLTHQTHQKEHLSKPVIGLYHLNEDTYQWMIQMLEHLINQGIFPIYIDEIGQLELKGKGFDQIIKKIMHQKIPLICTIRETSLDQVVGHYQMSSYEVIT